VHEARDVIWLKHMYYAKPKTGMEYIAMPIVIENHDLPSVSAAGPVITTNPTTKVGEGDTQPIEVEANEATEPNEPSQLIQNPGPVNPGLWITPMPI